MPIDSLIWDFNVLTIEENSVQQPPETGVYVKGLYLEGAGWDKKNALLIEPQPMQLVSSMPLIHFKPVEQTKKKSKGGITIPEKEQWFYPDIFRILSLSSLLFSYKGGGG